MAIIPLTEPRIVLDNAVTLRLATFILTLIFLTTTTLPFGSTAVPMIYAAEPSIATLDRAPFGLNTHLATRYTNPAGMDAPAEVVAQSGAGWAREDVHWWRVEPRDGVWDWTFTDAAFRALLQRNINIVGVLGHPPGWATPYSGDDPNNVSFYAPDQQRFVAYARAVVQRYGAYIHHWEIWNEPDSPLFWKPAPDAVAYARLLGETSAAIHSIDPQAHVLLGGINPFDMTFLNQVAETGVWNSFDIVAIHPYVDPHSPEDGDLVAAADGLRALMSRYGEKPIWATEIGWSSGAGDHDAVGVVDEQMQANYLVRAMLLLWRAGIERSFWYALKDDPGNPYGLVALGTGRDDFSRLKPAYNAFRTLNTQLGGASFVRLSNALSESPVIDFETFGRWNRGDQPYGTLTPTVATLHDGGVAAAISYTFPSPDNDYVVFRRSTPAAIPGTPRELNIWVYGDGSGNVLKAWLRDAEGELLQYTFGAVGAKGWHQLHVSLAAPVAPWDRIAGVGNGRLDFPAALDALILDDAPDSFAGRGTVYLDGITATSGPEAYHLRAQRGTTVIDVLWSPEGIQAQLPLRSAQATGIDRDGSASTLVAPNTTVALPLSDAPRYVISAEK